MLALNMYKKVIVIFFNLLFFVSTTGLPLTIHFCSMTETEMTESPKCECQVMNNSNMHKACNMTKDASKDISVKAQHCCESEIALKYVKDSFLINKTEIQKNITFSKILVSLLPLHENIKTFTNFSYTDTSPPLLSSNQLYIYNSTLLI